MPAEPLLFPRASGPTRRFLAAYFQTAKGAPFLESISREEVSALLELYRLEKVIYELGYELNNRPTWVRIPLAGLLTITKSFAD